MGSEDADKWNLDIMEYIGPIESKITKDGRGRGLHATRDIKKGEFVIVEKCFATVKQSLTLSEAEKMQLGLLLKFDSREPNLYLACEMLKKIRSKKVW